MWKWNSKGITLVEVMAATVLLGLAVVMFVSISGYMSDTRNSDDRRTEALTIAEKTLSEYRALYAEPLNRVSTTLSTISISNEEITPPTQPFNYSVKIQHSPIDVMNVSPGSLNYNMTGVKSKYVSLQAIVLVKYTVTNDYVPRLMTVIVSWDV